jgi:hypothetical protein
VRFNFRAQYGDGSFVEITSLKELQQYTELRNTDTVSIVLFFVILAKFPQDSRTFQRQSVLLQFIRPPSTSTSRRHKFYEYFSYHTGTRNAIYVEVEYSEFSWGYDIVNLLSNEIEKLEIREIFLVDFVSKYRMLSSIIVAALFLFVGIFFFTDRFSELRGAMELQRESSLNELIDSDITIRQFFVNTQVLFEQYEEERSNRRFDAFMTMILLLIGSVAIALFVHYLISNMRHKTIIIFTKRDRENSKIANRKSLLSIAGFTFSNLLAILLAALSFYLS